MKPGSDKRLLGSACALAVIVASCVWLGAPLLRLGRGRSLGASQLQPTVHTLQRARNTQHIAYREAQSGLPAAQRSNVLQLRCFLSVQVSQWLICRMPIAEPAASGTDDTSAPFSPAARRLFGPPQPAVWLDEQTPAFEPAAYAAHYGDMFNMTDEDLANHFRSAGRGERRVPQRMRLILRYGDSQQASAAASHGRSVMLFSQQVQRFRAAELDRRRRRDQRPSWCVAATRRPAGRTPGCSSAACATRSTATSACWRSPWSWAQKRCARRTARAMMSGSGPGVGARAAVDDPN